MADHLEDDVWQPFLRFASRGSAEAVAVVLDAERVPTLLVAGSVVAGVDADFVLAVPAALAHRARWVLAQSDFTDAELEFLATGELGSDD